MNLKDLFFTAEDFYKATITARFTSADAASVAQVANAILRAKLEKAHEVFMQCDETLFLRNGNVRFVRNSGDTHRARLVCVEKIE